jgi:digeranylgeranylglycerophospholipid reductase
MINVAIIGAGPAGSYCAYKLAEQDIYPTLFDHSHPREKPCGGLMHANAQDFFPFIKNIPVEHSERNSMHLISPSGRRTIIRFRKGVLRGFSRLKFDQYLLNMALNRGSELIKEKVIGLEHKYGWWKVKTQRQSYAVKTLVGADGVNSLVRRNTIGSLSKADKGLCFGYFIKGLEREGITIKILPNRGYMWIIPRGETTSIGVGSLRIFRPNELRNLLNVFISEYCPQAEKIAEWAALIPNVRDVKTFHQPIAGPNIILIGDAAGHVSPISGSGIAYALLDGKLAAETIVEGHPELFNERWIKTYGQWLLLETRLRDWVYKQPLLELYSMYLKIQSAMPFT